MLIRELVHPLIDLSEDRGKQISSLKSQDASRPSNLRNDPDQLEGSNLSLDSCCGFSGPITPSRAELTLSGLWRLFWRAFKRTVALFLP